ncbi:transcription factor S-II, central domain protein [Gregarina niphandrodes]|uniref:Transcription factor S-II, central domain protein n=1 Tax=Gregarina niphandrodes TaxID=110365 RepID=A0A023B0H5_GRENI|nr:transcription factor S-II, central domain protein [Gregarina niphandrodes]EZG44293.1 transcription factor S-II, central domain protein [Gregarina niphandrodes]|eukprot:XP_011132720.1 transcription factor S-II, central domain protein [Gregarina niphandrodes]
MDSIATKFREIFRRGLCEYAVEKGRLPAGTDVEGTSVEVVQAALEGEEYLGKGAVDAPLYISCVVVDALEQANEDRLWIRQKGYEIYQNLKRDHSVRHRVRIISGDLSVAALVSMDAKELAPESVKRRRREEEQKYLKEQVILTDASPGTLKKTHRGLEAMHETPLDTPQGSLSPRLEAVQDTKAYTETNTTFGNASFSVKLHWDTRQLGDCPGATELLDNWNNSAWTELHSFADLKLPHLPPNPYPCTREQVTTRLQRRYLWIKQRHPELPQLYDETANILASQAT